MNSEDKAKRRIRLENSRKPRDPSWRIMRTRKGGQHTPTKRKQERMERERWN